MLNIHNNIQENKKNDLKEKDINEKIRNIQQNAELEIESLKFKLDQANVLIERSRREKKAIQDGLKKA